MTLTITAVPSGTKTLVTVTSSPTLVSSLKVWRVHPDGSRYRVLTVGQATLIGSWAGFDYHGPFNRALTYVAEAGGSTSAASSPTWRISKESWIVHPSDQSLSMPVKLVGPPSETTTDESSQKFQVLGRKLPVHRISRPRGGEVSSLTVLAETSTEIARIKALFADGGQLLLNTVWEDDMDWMWVQPKPLTRAVLGRAASEVREFTFSYEQTSPPDADLVPIWTFDKVAADFSTFDDVTAAYADFQAMQLDVRS